MKQIFDWTTGFDLNLKPYEVEEHDDKLELVIPVFNVNKKDIKIKPYGRWGNQIKITIPDTILSNERELTFKIDDRYSISEIKANVRDGILFIHIPLKEERKFSHIEIT